MTAANITATRTGIKLDSAGDARLWIAPRRDGTGTTTLLRVTTTTGTKISLRLTEGDVARLADTAADAAATTDADREHLLDKAAAAIAAVDLAALPHSNDDNAIEVDLLGR